MVLELQFVTFYDIKRIHKITNHSKFNKIIINTAALKAIIDKYPDRQTKILIKTFKLKKKCMKK